MSVAQWLRETEHDDQHSRPASGRFTTSPWTTQTALTTSQKHGTGALRHCSVRTIRPSGHASSCCRQMLPMQPASSWNTWKTTPTVADATTAARSLHGDWSTTMNDDRLNINFFLLPTKFLQPVNLAISTIWSLFNPLAVPALELLSLFLAHLQSPHWKSQIAHSDMHHSVSGINSLQIPSASPFTSRLTSSFICQLSSIIITTLIIHHSFTLSLQVQNLPFQQTLPTLDFFYLPDCLRDNRTGPDRTYHAHRFIFRFTY